MFDMLLSRDYSARVLLVVGLVPLSILIFLVRGRAKIKMDREHLSGSIGALLINKTITISNHSITGCGNRQSGREYTIDHFIGFKYHQKLHRQIVRTRHATDMEL